MQSEPLNVLKYGGSAVADTARIDAVARDVLDEARRGQRIVVVVSAMGNETDRLIALVRQVNPTASKVHEDMVVQTGEVQTVGLLAAAIERHGGNVAVFTSQQVGFVGSDTPGNARLQQVRGVELVQQELAGKIVVLPGFQAVTASGQLVTLGRGGSDLTAVGISVVLQAACCTFKKDVDGLSPVDPRLVQDACIYAELDYDQARDVAQDVVLMDRAISLAQAHAVTLRVVRSPSIGPSTGGTTIRNASTHDALEPEPRPITSVRVHQDLALVKIIGVPDRPGQAARLFDAVRTISISDAIQAERTGASAVISFLVHAAQLPEALARIHTIHRNARGRVGYVGLTVLDRRMREGSGFLARVTGALARARANISLISTSGPAITVGIQTSRLKRAVAAVADEFDLRQRSA